MGSLWPQRQIITLSGSRLTARLRCSPACWIFLDHVPCIGRRIPIHCSTREVPSASLTIASHYGLLDVLSSPGLAGSSCFGALHSRELPGASLSLSPSHTSSVRALSFPPDFRPPGKMLLMSSVTSGTHCALFLLADMTHTVICVGYN